ncbi:hypothetical protein LTR70_009891 [Exophiala xenobiotica]|uniref:Rhodopsin domain-containing protein n=1 Tax=Lithohypha guttulata TaxID=1690604 RepID=A0ABR0JU34_9EURO|nr:hypothetical protein LTR24_010492 [Lithohypha guttulata]KAK5309910.1 hypothetical protein LTR70_009891 [Exophiala xenobiotica]
MSDPKVDAAIQDGRMPDGVTAEYLNESRDQPALTGIIFVTALTSIMLIARCLSRIFLLRRFGWDDGLAFLSWLLFIPFVVLCIILIRLGSGRHYEYIQYVLNLDTVNETEALDFGAHLLYTISLVICRVSGLALYAAICKQHHTYVWAIRGVAGVIILAYLPQIFLLVFHCVPVTALWPYDWQPESNNHTCLTWGLVYSVNSAVSLFSDLLLYGIPVVMIWNLTLSRKRKVQLACILLPGILVIAISIARLVLVIRGQWLADMSWSYNPMLAVEVSEIGATLISLSIPGVKPLIDNYIRRKDKSTTRGGNTYFSGRGPRGTPLRQLRSTHTQIDDGESHERTNAPSNDSKEGILVKMKYRVEA